MQIDTRLASIPPDIIECLLKTVGKPPKGAMDKKATLELIGKLVQSDQGKTRCGKRLIAFYQSQGGGA